MAVMRPFVLVDQPEDLAAPYPCRRQVSDRGHGDAAAAWRSQVPDPVQAMLGGVLVKHCGC
jgi:hypothetical protein